MANSVNQFFKENRETRGNELYPASDMFKDEKGEPLKWEIRPLTRKQVEKIRSQAKNESEFGLNIVAASVVDPDLNNSKLQDSYGVKKAVDLLDELLNAAEYYALLMKVFELNDLDKTFADRVVEAKN